MLQSNLPQTDLESSDQAILDYIRRSGAVSVSELVKKTGVTATAIRQRLARLMADGQIERKTERASRGRPGFKYTLSEKGLQACGNSYQELAFTLWSEIRTISDQAVRKGLLQRIAEKMAMYYPSIAGGSLKDRMNTLVNQMESNGLPCDLQVEESSQLPILKTYACPYPELAEQDRGICAMEKMFFSQVVGENLRLTECRLDGGNCCSFEVAAS